MTQDHRQLASTGPQNFGDDTIRACSIHSVLYYVSSFINTLRATNQHSVRVAMGKSCLKVISVYIPQYINYS